ncbi:MAG: hypothetical protein QNJ94_22310 [Alphaproteobacteria bacterium]|nr:hypothetical protein [Alphaproteobacteria bacterium]
MNQKRTTESILKEAEDTLYTAELGLKLVKGKNPKQRMAGLRNLVVFGRAVTNVLQNLRSTEGDAFDKWYQPKVEEMRNDPVSKYFYTLRSKLLKEGSLNTSSSATLSGNPMALMQLYEAPPGAKGFFVVDRIGGCGWEVELEPGVTEKFYVDVPDNIPGLQLRISVHLPDTPEGLKEKTIQELSEHYLSYLSMLLREAKKVFL